MGRISWYARGGGRTHAIVVGLHAAQMSVQMMAAVLLHNFQFEPIHPTQKEIPVDYDITVTIPADHTSRGTVTNATQEICLVCLILSCRIHSATDSCISVAKGCCSRVRLNECNLLMLTTGCKRA